MELSADHWVLIASTLFLGAAALLAPTAAEYTKRRFFSPRLRINFRAEPPDCHRTEQDLTLGTAFHSRMPVYYFRFRVANVGKSQAKRCEAVLESLSRADAAGRFAPYPRFTPVSLNWSGRGDFVEINPTRTAFCDLIMVPHVSHQKALHEHGGYVDWPNLSTPDLGVVICARSSYYAQPNRLPSGTYRLDVAIYSENADPVRRTFELAWSGRWCNDEDSMFRECVLS